MALAVATLASAILATHAVALRADTDLSDLRSPRRYWEDACVAAKLFLDQRYGPFSERASPARLEDGFEVCSRLIIGGAARQEVRPWEFWRTIRLRPFIHFREYLVRLPPFSDPGRAALTAATYFVVGGVSPFAVLWVGVLVAIPLVFWTAWEFGHAEVPWAGAVLLLLLAASPFFVESLTLPHGTLGFYMLAVLGVAPLAAYTTLASAVTPARLLARALPAGMVIAVCCVCRSAAAAVIPGYILALALGALRLPARRSRWAVAVAGLVLLVGPYAAVRPAAHHDIWVALWEGLGDFDRTKGHYWNDGEAKNELVRAGFTLGDGMYGWITEGAEAHLRRVVLHDIASDPVWFARILVRRVWATITQEKLRAWTSLDWRAIVSTLTTYEDGMRKNFSWATPVNRFGSGPRRIVVPVVLLFAPTLALLALALARAQRPAMAAARLLARRSLPPMGCVAVGALALPVMITTAGMLETQTFVFVYLLGSGFLVQAVVEALSLRGGRPTATSASNAAASR